MNLQRLQEIWDMSRDGARHYHTSPLRIFLRFRKVSKKFHVHPEEACRLGMVDPNLDDPYLRRRFIGKDDLLKIQLQYNPRNLLGLTEDKAVFYAYCRGHRIPHPEVLAVIGPLGGWKGDGTPIRQRSHWEDFFTKQLPERFIVKPTDTWHGDNVYLITRTDSIFEDNEGTKRTAVQLYDYFLSGSPTSRWVIQEVLENRPEIIRLTGSEAVSTCRMMTRIDETGRCRLFHAHFRIIVGRNVVDNIRLGQTGNLEANVDINRGVLDQCVEAGTKWGSRDIDTHPDTGLRVLGFQLPDWEKARELVESIAPKFLPARMLGWDVAFTPEGPSIVETNACWDPPNEVDHMSHVIEVLREDYEKRIGSNPSSPYK